MTNLIFSRREVQRALDDLALVLNEKQLLPLINKLNKPGEQRLPTTWEVVLLRELSKFPNFQYEEPLPSGRTPDFRFTVDVDGKGVEVIGDITAPSDQGQENSNPIRPLCDELVRAARKLKVDPDKLRLYPQGNTSGPRGRVKARLFVPEKKHIADFSKRYFMPFLIEVARASHEARQVMIEEDDIRIELGYDPNQRYFRTGHLKVTVAYSATENPVFRAIKDKADQLSSAPPDAIRLVIVADGNCNSLDENSHSAGGQYRTYDIIQEVFRQVSSIDLVLLLPIIDGPLNHLTRQSSIYIKPSLWKNHGGERRPALSDERFHAIAKALTDVVTKLPAPKRTPLNAKHRERIITFSAKGFDGYTMSGQKISVSSRFILDILSGVIRSEDVPQEWKEMFLRKLTSGESIVDAKLVANPHDDDDQLEFTFSPFDAAIAPFKLKNPTIDG